MTHRYIAGGLLILSLTAILYGYLLTWHPEILGLCTKGVDCLSENLLFGIGSPLYWSIRWLPALFLVLIFVRKEAFWAWAKFIWPFAAIGILLIVISPPIGALGIPDRTYVTERVSEILTILSIIPIAYKYWRLSQHSAPPSITRVQS